MEPESKEHHKDNKENIDSILKDPFERAKICHMFASRLLSKYPNCKSKYHPRLERTLIFDDCNGTKWVNPNNDKSVIYHIEDNQRILKGIHIISNKQ